MRLVIQTRFIALLASMLLLASCAKEAAQTEAMPPLVRHEAVSRASHGGERVYNGSIQAGNESRISFRTGGVVNEVLVRVGQRVLANQDLLKLEAEDAQLQYEQARAALSQAEAMERSSGQTWQRVQQLYASGNASRQDLEGARAQAESGIASVTQARSQVELARRQLDYTTLRAPYRATVAQIMAEEGEVVAPGHPVIELVSQDAMEVVIHVPESMIADIEEGQSALVDLPALGLKDVMAVVRESGTASVGVGATYPVTLDFLQWPAGARSGMAAEVHLEAGSEVGSLWINAYAVGEDQEGRYVYLLQEIGDSLAVARRVEVQTGRLGERGLQILDGLEEGDLVVTAGISQVREGLRVRLK